MKVTLNIVGGLLVVVGAIWFLQGINVLPGSFMTGQIRWAIIGGIAVAAGVALLFVANRRGARRALDRVLLKNGSDAALLGALAPCCT